MWKDGEAMTDNQVTAYLCRGDVPDCDKSHCFHSDGPCERTTDISHARNFVMAAPDCYYEVGETERSSLIADVLAPVCVDEKERRAFERGRVHERFAQQIFKEATS